ncbi:hypothetical protein [Tianweitania sediminis]|uniref:Uncharacterized protein n=1 Tax=Tianweitania sediminis TaxID=1502156 RepID=A0A8J7RL67_9HYPH|nr:hypothetical protein [Tianweitania sediminis]MBP0439221.1 hypothetical protein [Tianweitania sediminis]
MVPKLLYPGGVALGLLLALGSASIAEAKPARCFTTDDGTYSCAFETLDAKGSFQISAEGKPTFSLWIDSPGVASGSANFGDRDVALPGLYLRQSDDAACWRNNETETKICAW